MISKRVILSMRSVQTMMVRFHFHLACVASVSVGLFAGLKHFSLLERAKIGASAKNDGKMQKTPRTGGKPYGNACYAG